MDNDLSSPRYIKYKDQSTQCNSNRNNHNHSSKKRKLSLPLDGENQTRNQDYIDQIGDFLIGKTIGKGTFGKVKLGTHVKTGEKSAIKILDKIKLLDETDKTRLEREIKILKTAFHHNIIKLYSVCETKNKIYIITEYIEGGELFTYISLKHRLSEVEACKFFHQIIDAVDYLHKIGICHRDLKPENMLLDYNKNIKIIDFGLSNLYHHNELLKSACGSPGYASPEMIMGYEYSGLMTDLWSCGIVLYVMMVGKLPFEDISEYKLYEKIIRGNVYLPNFLSNEAKDFIPKILNINPSKRIDIEGIRRHPWYNIITIPKIEGLFISIHPIPVDNFIVDELEQLNYDRKTIIKYIVENRHNDITTYYYLLIRKYCKNGYESISDLVSKQFRIYINKINKNKNNIEPKYLIDCQRKIISIENDYNESLNNYNYNYTKRNVSMDKNIISLVKKSQHNISDCKDCKSEFSSSINMNTNLNRSNASNKEKSSDYKLIYDYKNNVNKCRHRNLSSMEMNGITNNKFTSNNYTCYNNKLYVSSNNETANTFCNSNKYQETKIINFKKIYNKKKNLNSRNENEHYLVTQLKNQYKRYFKKNEGSNSTYSEKSRNRSNNRTRLNFKRNFLITSIIFNNTKDRSLHNNTFTSQNSNEKFLFTNKNKSNSSKNNQNNNRKFIKYNKYIEQNNCNNCNNSNNSKDIRQKFFFSLPKQQKYKDKFIVKNLQLKYINNNNNNNLSTLSCANRTKKGEKNLTISNDKKNGNISSANGMSHIESINSNNNDYTKSRDKNKKVKGKSINVSLNDIQKPFNLVQPRFKKIPNNKINLTIFLNNNYKNNVIKSRNRNLSCQNNSCCSNVKMNKTLRAGKDIMNLGLNTNSNLNQTKVNMKNLVGYSKVYEHTNKNSQRNNSIKEYYNIKINGQTNKNRSAEKITSMVPNCINKQLFKFLGKKFVIKSDKQQKPISNEKNLNSNVTPNNFNNLPYYNNKACINYIFDLNPKIIYEIIINFLNKNGIQFCSGSNYIYCSKGTSKFNIELYRLKSIRNGIYIKINYITGNKEGYLRIKKAIISSINNEAKNNPEKYEL